MSDSEDEYVDSELDEIAEVAEDELKSGKLPYTDKGGCYFCPFCARKKSSYKFNELFRHAEDGAKGQKDVKYRGKHHALAQVLKSLPRAPLPNNSAATIQQRAPEVKEGTRFVYPWKAMVCNIATQAAQNAANGAGLVGPAKDQMHAHFNKPDQNFHVDSVFLPYNFKGQTDMAVVGFQKGMEGYEHAQTFERSFQASDHGRFAWLNHRKAPGSGMYAWLLTKEDVENGSQPWQWPPSLKEHFKKQMNKGTKTRDEAQQEEKGRQQEEKERRVEEERKRRAADKLKEEEFKRTLSLKDYELQSRDDAVRSLQGQTEVLFGNLRVMDEQLAKEKNTREEREKEIDDMKSKSQSEMQRMHRGMAEAKRMQEAKYRQQQEQLNKQMVELRRQINHKDATNEEQLKTNERVGREMAVLENQMRHSEQQRSERERLNKAQQDDKKLKVETDTERERDLLRMHREQYEVLIEKQKKIKEVEKDGNAVMKEMQEDIDYKDSTLNTYVVRDRVMNDELQDARKEAVKYVADEDIQEIVNFFPETELPLAIHHSGELDHKVWNPAFEEKYGEDWQFKGSHAMDKYLDLVLNPQTMYFRVVQENGEDKHVPKYDDPVILEIKKKFGNKAMEDFLRASLDHMALAASASYSVPVVWNPRLDLKATLAEVIHFAKACGDVLIEQNKALKAQLPTEPKRKSQRNRL